MKIARRLVAVAVACATMMALVGCARALPPGPTDDELAAYAQTMLDATWANTGLEEHMPRPVPASSVVPWQDSADWSKAITACMTRAGLTDMGIAWSAGSGYRLASGSDNGVDLDDESQLAFYGCVELNPLGLTEGVPLIGQAELDYTYDYFQDWLVPCLTSAGYRVAVALTKAEFRQSYGEWSPYWSLAVPLNATEHDRVVSACGAEFPLSR